MRTVCRVIKDIAALAHIELAVYLTSSMKQENKRDFFSLRHRTDTFVECLRNIGGLIALVFGWVCSGQVAKNHVGRVY